MALNVTGSVFDKALIRYKSVKIGITKFLIETVVSTFKENTYEYLKTRYSHLPLRLRFSYFPFPVKYGATSGKPPKAPIWPLIFRQRSARPWPCWRGNYNTSSSHRCKYLVISFRRDLASLKAELSAKLFAKIWKKIATKLNTYIYTEVIHLPS